jgi:hypothetical protein
MKEILDAMKIRKLVQGGLERSFNEDRRLPATGVPVFQYNPGSPGHRDIPFQALPKLGFRRAEYDDVSSACL